MTITKTITIIIDNSHNIVHTGSKVSGEDELFDTLRYYQRNAEPDVEYRAVEAQMTITFE
jgi:hypothetical protein